MSGWCLEFIMNKALRIVLDNALIGHDYILLQNILQISGVTERLPIRIAHDLFCMFLTPKHTMVLSLMSQDQGIIENTYPHSPKQKVSRNYSGWPVFVKNQLLSSRYQ